MVYHVIGTMSGSSMDGLDIAYCTFEEIGGKWSYTIHHAECIPFDDIWRSNLASCTSCSARELFRMHTAFGHWMGNAIQSFIQKYSLEHKVHLVASHGHTVFHEPQFHTTFQMGDGAAIAAITKLPVVSDLRNMDIALGGQGAPIVPIGEKLLWNDFKYFLNLGGICNITVQQENQHIAFDICAANRVLNMLSQQLNLTHDEGGEEAKKGSVNEELLHQLNQQEYYSKSYPKSLANEFGVDIIYPILEKFAISVHDKLHTYCIHIAKQIKNALLNFDHATPSKMLITGGGAYHHFLIETIQSELKTLQIEIEIPSKQLIDNKEALVMGLIGVLRWREENNVISDVTGASRSSVGGALWMGQE